MIRWSRRSTLLAAAAASLAVARPRRLLAAGEVLVFAPATLVTALDAVIAAYRQAGGPTIKVSYAPTPALVRQLEAGAPADLFISADSEWMDQAQAKGLIRSETRINLLGSRLVLIAPAASTVHAEIKPGFPLAQLLGDGHLVVCDPMMMPAGRYARASLQSLNVWSSVKDRVANADSVRAALAYVSRGEAPLGIVFDTDAAVDPGVRVVGVFPADSHPPIVYPVAITASSTNAAAPALLAFVRSDAARMIFERFGYYKVAP